MSSPLRLHGRCYDAFLFDMDGTLLDSTTVVERVWGRWALRHGLDPAVLIPTVHGVRAVDVITRLGLPGVDAQAESIAIQTEELADVDGIKPVYGAIDFLNALPRDRWAIVTSAPIELARRRMTAAGIPFPISSSAGRMSPKASQIRPVTCWVRKNSESIPANAWSSKTLSPASLPEKAQAPILP